MTSKDLRAVLTATASHLPSERLTNEMLAEAMPEFDAAKVESSTGVVSRRVAAAEEFTSDLAMQAARNLFDEDPSRREGIDFMILVTSTPDYLIPSTAAIVQDGLELPTSVGAVDVCLACSGYTYALTLASGLLESDRAKKVLILTADRYSPYVELGAAGVRALFGDAGTATIVEQAPAGSDLPGGRVGVCGYGTDGAGYRHLIAPTSACRGVVGAETTELAKPTLEMNGSQVFDFTLRVIPGFIRETLAANELALDEIDVFVFHQANAFMLNHLRRRLRIPEEKFVLYISDTGNTGASTIPLALDVASRDGRIQPGNRVLLVGFGTGFSWSSTVLEYGS